MATSEIYEMTVDEDVPTDTAACPDCGGQVRTNSVETVCEDCGLVIAADKIDRGPEWRSIDDDTAAGKRTGSSLTIARHDRGLSTEIGQAPGSDTDRSRRKRRQLGRLRRQQRRGCFRSKAERNLAHGLGEVRRIAGALGLSESVRDQACYLFRSAQQEGLLPGRSIEAMAAGSIHGACRCNGLARPLADVVDVARVARSRVANAFQVLNRELGLPTQPVRASAVVPRVASALGVSTTVRRRATTLAKRAQEITVATGCKPSGLAAACLYRAARDVGASLTQQALADAAGISVTTLRARRNDLDSAGFSIQG